MNQPTSLLGRDSEVARRFNAQVEALKNWISTHDVHVRWGVALLSSSLLAVACWRWYVAAEALWTPCKGVDDPCSAPPIAFRWAQALSAGAGVAAAVATALLSLLQAYRGERVPALRITSTALVFAGATWLLIAWCIDGDLMTVAQVLAAVSLPVGGYALLGFFMGLRRTEAGIARLVRLLTVLAWLAGFAAGLVVLHVMCALVEF